MAISTEQKGILLTFWALLGCPIVFTASYYLYFSFSDGNGITTRTLFPSVFTYLAAGALLLTGLAGLFYAKHTRIGKIIYGLMYIVAMSGEFYYLALWITLSKGASV